MNSRWSKISTVGFMIQSSWFWISGCGTESHPTELTSPIRSQENNAELISSIEGQTPKITLTHIQDKATSQQTILNIDYKTSDYVSVLRCRSNYKLRSPTGNIIRTESGQIVSKNQLELRAVWDAAFSAITSCRILSERIVRHAFTDPLAASGNYFYIFNPCREKLSTVTASPQTFCSYAIQSSQDIQVTSTVDQKYFQLSENLFRKEAQLASVILNFREGLMTNLRAQQSCENQASVDAVQEARRKALMSVLLTSVAASVGGAVAGSQGALEAALQTLEWIKNNTNLRSRSQPSQCKQLVDSEALAAEQAIKIDVISKEISQLRTELALTLPTSK